MKKIFGLAVGMLLSVATIAQSGVTFNDAVDGYNKATAHTFHFSFSSNYTLEQVNNAATFYTSYFTVAATAAGDGLSVNITLVEDNEMSRRVVTRFFSYLEVENVTVNGTHIMRDDFVSQYIML